MEKSAEHFFRYSKNGTLIYCLNKKTGDKVAAFYEVGEGISFWNAEDARIDSLFSGLPSYIMDVIRGIVTDKPFPNRSLSPKVWQNSKDLWETSQNKAIVVREEPVLVESENDYSQVFEEVSDMVDIDFRYTENMNLSFLGELRREG
jgi:hypothetical protein